MFCVTQLFIYRQTREALLYTNGQLIKASSTRSFSSVVTFVLEKTLVFQFNLKLLSKFTSYVVYGYLLNRQNPSSITRLNIAAMRNAADVNSCYHSLSPFLAAACKNPHLQFPRMNSLQFSYYCVSIVIDMMLSGSRICSTSYN